MNPIIDCFTREQLQQYVLGKLPLDLCDQVARHLDDCDVCEDTVVGLDQAHDTLVDLLGENEPQSDQAPSHGTRNGHAIDRNGSEHAEQSNEELPEFQSAVDAIRRQSFVLVDGPAEPIGRDEFGVRIGDYEIQQQIATGGMGNIFRARHVRLEKTVAIKILPERKMQNGAAISRFTREMKIIGRLDHPTMVRATDAGEADGTHYLVMELVDGLDLARVVRLCGPLLPADACELIRCAALGLQYAHEQGVIHRDVKPSNLMLSRTGSLKILDLGLATLGGLNGTVDELTTVGQLMGTLDYMAPEQCGNNHAIDNRTDVYGLGATLYKLLTGLAPYSSDAADTPLKKLKAMAIESPTPILLRRPELPNRLAAIVEQAIEREPESRFESTAELAAALEPLCEGHQLPELLARSEQIARQTSTRSAGQINLQAVTHSTQPKSMDGISKPKSSFSELNSPARSAKRSFVRWISAACLLGLAGMLIWQGIVIYLDTIAGQLIIESEIDDISVSVVADEVPTKEISIQHGVNSTRLRAGKYRIEINGDSDGLVIQNDQFQLKKGDRVVARITKRVVEPKSETASLAPTTTEPPATEQSKVANDASSIGTNSEFANELELIDLQHDVELAKLNLTAVENQLQRIENLAAKGSVPSSELVQMKSNLDVAKLELSRAESKYAAATKISEQKQTSRIQTLNHEIDSIELKCQQSQSELKHIETLCQKGLVTEQEVSRLRFKLQSELEQLEKLNTQLGFAAVTTSSEPKPAIANEAASANVPDNSAAATFDGSTLQQYLSGWIQFAISNHGKQNPRELIYPIETLAKQSTPEQINKLIFHTIAENRNEISLDIQFGIVAGLSLICISPESTKLVLEYIAELTNRIAYEAGNNNGLTPAIDAYFSFSKTQFETVEAFLLDHYEAGSAQEKLVALGWMQQDFSEGRGLGYGFNSLVVDNTSLVVDRPVNREVSDKWLPILLSESTSKLPDVAELSTRLLAWHWLDQPQVIQHFEQKLLVTDNKRVHHFAVQVMIQRNPKLSGLIPHIQAAIKNDGGSPVYLLQVFENVDAFEAIKQFLENPQTGSKPMTKKMWGGFPGGGRAGDSSRGGMRGLAMGGLGMGGGTASLGLGPGADAGGGAEEEALDFSPRFVFIQTLAGMIRVSNSHSESISTVVISPADQQRLLPLIKKVLDQANEPYLLTVAWECIAAITGQPLPSLYEGRTLDQWLKILGQEKIDDAKLANCLQAISQTQDALSPTTIVAIAKAFRGRSFAELNPKAVSEKKLIEIVQQHSSDFVSSLDYLEDDDAMFGLFVLVHYPSRLTGSDDDVFRRFARRFISSENEQLSRRAIYVAVPRDGRSKSPSRSDRDDLDFVEDILNSENRSLELKLSLLEQLESSTNWNWETFSAILAFKDIDDPRAVVTILELAKEKKQQNSISRFLIEQLAANRAYLDESHAPIKLDLWNGPFEDGADSDPENRITVFSLLVNTLDAMDEKHLRQLVPSEPKPDDSEWVNEWREQATAAIKNLVNRYRQSDGATQRILARILKTLAPESVESQ